MLNWPRLSPRSASRRLLAKARNSSRLVAASRIFEALPRLPVEALKLPDKRAVGKGLGSFLAVAQNHGPHQQIITIYVNRK